MATALVAEPLPSSPQAFGSDFNCDGVSDLAVAGFDYPSRSDLPIWVLNVIYGSTRGLTAARNQSWRQLEFSGGAAVPHLIASLATGDFDGDGCADLAIGSSPADPELGSQHGEVRIIYGSRQGLRQERSDVWTRFSPAAPGNVTEPDGFGSALVAANFGRSAHDDLAVGAHEQDQTRGAVTVFYGSDSGLTAQGRQIWSQATPGVPGIAEPTDEFGTSLAAAPFTGGPYADLAIGVPGNGVTRAHEGPGAVNILYGSPSGLIARGGQLWKRDSPGVKGRAVRDEHFGSSLAAGHFAGRASADLAIGDGGAVNVIYGSRRGLRAKGDQLWTPKSDGLAGRQYLDAAFGRTLTVGNFGRDDEGKRFDDLAVGASADYVVVDESGGTEGGWTGVVEVLYGTAKGLSARHSQSWQWHTPGIKGNPTGHNEYFGESLTAGNFGKDRTGRGYDDLAAADGGIGARSDLYGGISVIYGSDPGLKAFGDQLWTVPKLGRSAPRFFAVALGAS
jgi:hypothetical protein